MVLASMLGGGDEEPVAQVDPQATAHVPPDIPATSNHNRPNNADNPSPAETASPTQEAPAEASTESIADAESDEALPEPPSIAGVVADRVVVWNQHNSIWQKWGTTQFHLLLLRDGATVWRKDLITLPWSPDQDTSVAVPIPSERFDRVRVEIVNFAPHEGGGLAEIQVLQGGKNLARDCPTIASGAFDERFHGDHVTDGITTSAFGSDGYWLLPDHSTGWIEVDLALPRPEDYAGLTAEKVVVWNQHNAEANDRGAREFDLVLLLGDREVFRQKDVPSPWRPNEDTQMTIELPEIGFDRVRVEIDKFHGHSGGLAEVQVFRGGEYIARGAPVVPENVLDNLPEFAASRVTDGITSSANLRVGYWLSNSATPTWVEIDLVRHSPQLAVAARALGEYRCFVEGDWARGLPWLLRCDNAGLRNLAEAEQLDPSGPSELVTLGDAWWDLAEASPAAYRDKLRGRALWRYVKALPGLVEFSKPRIEKRIAEALPALPERDFLYFLTEELSSGLHPPHRLRDYNVVVDGRKYAYALWMHPAVNATSRAVFPLEQPYRRLVGAVGIVDWSLGQTATPQTFRIVGDGRLLWKSKPLQKSGASEPFDIDVTGVKKLELFVDCPGSNHAAGSAWLDPRLEE